ncbi:AP2 domain-containing protein [Staphylococcus epidermidis]|uniref:AP2 domain-containing protein n=1 Tax=Staphylococcus aureus TaxID=1280 RepID=UPI001577AA2B|nr:AP2 domain-containing protein [Staphylococcus aureus]MCG1833576.1 AP2 domain-containing protein [Staphylococcus epidermidis]MCG1977366.1 AP2 domain-containing protein [Staphylococcus epidermidis]MEC6083910.1 AP2 domain-containing protein [Staphylococcus aureus]CAC7012234.1 AP2 domain [Staphylococcus aureus]HCU9716194.1 AP2 domain-containing protein [Staphylococcus aureus]
MRVYIENIDDYILVNNEDFERVNFYKWHKLYANDTHKFLAQIVGRKTSLPAFILNDEYAYQKRKNHDFTRNNLATDKYSFRYRKPQKNSSSKYKGVSYERKSRKWVASICVKGKNIFLGRFSEEKDCAIAYNKAVKKYWNGKGYLNDID